MNRSEAEKNLVFIKNIMENSSHYGGNLFGVHLFIGLCGAVGAVVGAYTDFGQSINFLKYWMAIAVAVSILGSTALIFRSKIKDTEVELSTLYRLFHTVFPSCCAGALIGFTLLYYSDNSLIVHKMMTGLWIVLFGCALNSASLVVLKGLKYYSWVLIYGGGVTTVFIFKFNIESIHLHWIMGCFFGLMFLIYSAYLYNIEKKSDSEG